jgi:hypothetical protein
VHNFLVFTRNKNIFTVSGSLDNIDWHNGLEESDLLDKPWSFTIGEIVHSESSHGGADERSGSINTHIQSARISWLVHTGKHLLSSSLPD